MTPAVAYWLVLALVVSVGVNVLVGAFVVAQRRYYLAPAGRPYRNEPLFDCTSWCLVAVARGSHTRADVRTYVTTHGPSGYDLDVVLDRLIEVGLIAPSDDAAAPLQLTPAGFAAWWAHAFALVRR